MIKSRLTFLDPVLLTRLRKFNTIKARLRTRLQAMQAAEIVVAPPGKGFKANGDHELVVASYNIHKCVGTDGRFDPARIAAVIAEMDADVVAVQEADKRFGRRHGLLDLKALEKQTGLSLIPTSQEANGHGWHGNALLLRKGKVRDMRRLALPGAEPRGALVVDLDLPAGPLRLVAAHLGLLRRSRRWQVRSILDAIEHGPRMPILLVGDLNEWRPGRKSSLHELRPVFGPLAHTHFSFPSYFPVIALDRVIGSPGLVTAMEVHDSALARVASDHLPLKATIDIPSALKDMLGQQEVVLTEVGAV
jgi:endonuclease/exonuclease/phosphatase family metal-dependent hydrolase